MERPSVGDAVTSAQTVHQAAAAPTDAANNPCDDHSKDFMDCLDSHEIRLGKCIHHLRLLHQCRQRAEADAVTEPSTAHQPVVAVPAAPLRKADSSIHIPYASVTTKADSCHIPYQKYKNCLKDDVARLPECEFHLLLFFACHVRGRELWS